MTTHLSHPKYRPDIDGLRAIAVLAVVAFHAFPTGIKGGFIGVDIFFVISGYLISTIIFENLDRGTFSFLEFYARRVRRIFPALILVLIACFSVGWFTLLSDEYEQLGKHIAAGSGFISNFIFWSEAGYFDNAAETKPLLHLWSLGIEEQFYIVWPLLLWLAWKRKLNLLVLTTVLAAASFTLNVMGVEQDATATFYSPQTRFWELLSGGLLALAFTYKKGAFVTIRHSIDGRLSPFIHGKDKEIDGMTLSSLLSLLGLLLLAWGFWRINKDLYFPGMWALIPVSGTILLIAAGSKAFINRTILSSRILVWFGLISFPLYLWHWPLLSFATIFNFETPDCTVRIAAVLLSVMLAWLTYKCIEIPIRSQNHGKTTASVLLLLMTVAGCTGYYTFSNDGLGFRKFAKNNLDVFDYAKHWDGWDNCSIVNANSPKNGGCKILHKDRPIDVLVIGDSHAGHLASGLRSIFAGKRENVAVMLYSSCYPLYPVKYKSSPFFECPGNLVKHALDYAISTKSVNTIVLSGYPALHIQLSRFHEKSVASNDQIQTNLNAFSESVDKTLGALTLSKKKIIFVVDNPELLKDPKSCIQRIYTKACNLDITKEEYLTRNSGFLNLVNTYHNKFPNVLFTHTSEYFCDNLTCYGQRDGTLLYASRDHLTPNGSRYFVNSFKDFFTLTPDVKKPGNN